MGNMLKENLLSTQVYESIKRDIISLKYAPGTPLKERELAQSIGVSRTPVREALQRLSQECWVVPGDGKKILVSNISTEDINEVCQIRTIIEMAAMQWAVMQGDGRVLAGLLDNILNNMRKTDDQYTFTGLDLDFHTLVIENMHNSRILRFWDTIREEAQRIALMALQSKDRFAEVIIEHEMLVDYLWNKDSTKVFDALRVHIENSYKSFSNRINTLSTPDDL
ncbi:MAG: GntR family transcriptional regulator [Synergistaceae bacterium]|nr:GntR family transcriptional regulator [Synergistaceae bacterium]